jgi:membrane-associated phospholipid phosphatase
MIQLSLVDHRPCNILYKAVPIFVLFSLSLIALPILQGCGTLSNGRGWGQDATLTPGWDRIKESAVNAALSPETWVPVAASLVLQVDDMDKRISDWASKKTPVFGSQENASNWANYLEDSSGVVYFATVMATPSGDDPSGWLTAKVKGLAVGVAASGITAGGTSLLKKIAKRSRPNDPNSDKSLPSGHASGAAVFTTLARRNLESISLSPGSRLFADIGIVGLAIGTGWSRVEAKAHYPSDVLVGYALGHFFSAFINDAFLGLDNKKAPLVTFEPSRKDVFVGLHWMF